MTASRWPLKCLSRLGSSYNKSKKMYFIPPVFKPPRILKNVKNVFALTGVEITLQDRAWPNMFCTGSVINFLNSHFVRSFCEQKFENYLVPFYVSRYNEVEIVNSEDVYLPLNITNNNVSALFSAGRHFFFFFIHGNDNMLDFQSELYNYHRLFQFLYPDKMNDAKKVPKKLCSYGFLYFVLF